VVVPLVVAAAVAGVLTPGDGTRLTARSLAAASPSDPRTPVTGQVTAHDGRFWLGDQPITLQGTNLVVPCCTSSQFDTIRSWGMNFVRLHFQWSKLEPTAPVANGDGTWTHSYDQGYLSQIASAVTAATQSGLYVLVSSHGCQCTYFGYPDWLYQSPYNSHAFTYPQTTTGFALAQTDFWSDPLRQQFMNGALDAVATQLSAIQGVIGYEVMNEPQQGNLVNSAATTATILSWELQAGQSIRTVDPARVVFFTTRFGYAPGLPAADLSGFVQLGNTAFDLHDYFGGRWGTGLEEGPTNPAYEQALEAMYNHVLGTGTGTGPPSYSYIGTAYGQVRFLQNVLNSLGQWQIPLVVGEFGDRGDAGVYLFFGSVTAALNHLGLSWAASTYNGPEGFTNADGTLKPWGYLVVDAATQ